jgi:hypothetical protein
MGLTGLTAPQRWFLQDRWEGYVVAVYNKKANEHMGCMFDEWLLYFDMPSYTSSDNPDEKEYIANVVIKVRYNTKTDA